MSQQTTTYILRFSHSKNIPNISSSINLLLLNGDDIRSEEKKSAHVFVCITRIMLGLDKNQSNQQKVHILRIPNW